MLRYAFRSRLRPRHDHTRHPRRGCGLPGYQTPLFKHVRGASPGASGEATLPLTMRRCRFSITLDRRNTDHISPQSGRLPIPSLRTLSTLLAHCQRLTCQGNISPGEIFDHHLRAAIARGHADSSAHTPTTLTMAANEAGGHAGGGFIGILIMG